MDNNEAILDQLNLINPDEEREHTYDWPDDFLQRILGSLISDGYFLLQSAGLVKPEYFREDVHRFLCRSIIQYHEKYNDKPDGTILRAEINEKLAGHPNKDFYLAELDAVMDSFQPGVEKREYFLDKITEFAKTQAVRVAYNTTLDFFKSKRRDKWERIRETLTEALLVDRNVDLGLEYFNSVEDRYRRMMKAKEHRDFFPTGFDTIDAALDGGLARGEIGAFAGMCFAKNTKVLMYNGTTKRVQDVVVGDLLMGDDSTPRRVMKLSSGTDQLYKVTPVKGSPYIVNSKHILSLKSSVKKENRDSGVFNIPVEDFLNQSSSFQRSMKGWRTGVDFDYKPVRIDPYILGVWLGDGDKQEASITNIDDEIISSFYKEADNLGLVVRNQSGSKHIPIDYKANSREVRLELLAGLMDSDGSLSRGEYDFINKSKRLAEDVAYIARSLGLAAYIKPCQKKSQNGTEGDYFRVSISGDCSVIPVRVDCKRAPVRKQIKDVLVTGIKVEPCGIGEYYGFTVDKNHLFLLSDFTVTHNSGAGKSLALVKVAKTNVLKGRKVLYISLEMDEDKIAERFDTMLTNIPYRNLYRGTYPAEVKAILDESKEDWGQLVVKQFPAGTADVTTCRAFISQLQMHGFIPDIVAVDYVGEMKDIAGLKTYESRQRLVRDLRGMATELDICVFTAMQINRGGRDALKDQGYLDDDSLADSAGQVRPLDALWTISQTELEQKANCGVIFVSKHRSGKSRIKIHFYRDPDTLEIHEIGVERYKRELSAVQDKTKEDLMMEDMARDSWAPNKGMGFPTEEAE